MIVSPAYGLVFSWYQTQGLFRLLVPKCQRSIEVELRPVRGLVRRCKGTYYYLRSNGFGRGRPELSRDIPDYPLMSRHIPSRPFRKGTKKAPEDDSDAYKLQQWSVLFHIAITEMLLAIAVTSWHSQSYQLIIHDCRIRWQHDLTLLLHFFFVNDLSHNILMFVVNKMIEIPIKREEQRYAFSFQSAKQNLNFFSRFFAPKNWWHDNQTDAKIEPIFDPIYAKISRMPIDRGMREDEKKKL